MTTPENPKQLEELREEAIRTTSDLLAEAEPRRIGLMDWNIVPEHRWSIQPYASIPHLAMNGLLNRHLELRKRAFNLDWYGLYIEELAMVRRSRKEITNLQIVGTSLEGQSGYTDYSSWTESPLWSYDLTARDLSLPTAEAMNELLAKIQANESIDSKQVMLDPRFVEAGERE